MLASVVTTRLILRELRVDDDAFILKLLNEPEFIRNIADRNVRSLAAARDYMEDGPRASYRQNGFGMFAVSLTHSGEVIGLCGLIQRSWLPDPDLGYAYLAEHSGKGFATEAANAMLADAHRRRGLSRVLAIVNDDNAASIRVLTKVGYQREGVILHPEEQRDLPLYACNLSARFPHAF